MLECICLPIPGIKDFFLTNKTEINSYQMMMRREKYSEEEKTGSLMCSMSLVKDGEGDFIA